MDIYCAPDTLVVEPKILYFGTPVVLITTRNPDGTTNITPMSSAWALADRITIDLVDGGQGLGNLLRERECVLNLASDAMYPGVERLAPTVPPLPPCRITLGPNLQGGGVTPAAPIRLHKSGQWRNDRSGQALANLLLITGSISSRQWKWRYRLRRSPLDGLEYPPPPMEMHRC